MYINPDTDIRILSRVPLDSDYENTLYFDSLAAQTTYFANKTKYNLTKQTFNRVTNGVSRVGLSVGELYECNYIMFRNSAFSGKWFYAFINSIEYINNSVTEIHFTIDVIQTWFFDYKLEQCFIERQHSLTDGIGDNIVPEAIDAGELVYNPGSYGRVFPTEGEHSFVPYVIILSINDVTGREVFAGSYDQIPSGSKLWAFNSSDLEGVESKINEYVQRPEAVTALYVCPRVLLGWKPIQGGEDILAHYGLDTKNKSAVTFADPIPKMMQINANSTLDGYKPKNKKLLTYPYNYLEIITGSGNSLALRYEFFDGVPKLRVGGTISQPVSAYLRPENYKGGSYAALSMSDEQLTISGFPLGSWLNDAYEAWVAQQSVPLALGTISAVGSGFVGGLATGNPVAALAGAGMAGLGAVTNVLTEKYKASIAADQFHGSASSGSVNFSNVTLDFFGGRRCVTHQMAKIIDDYFNMFGYQQNIVDTPNRKARPIWTYIKTIGAQGGGAVPNDDAQKINSIYNNGIRFWKDPAKVGDFTGDNSPA